MRAHARSVSAAFLQRTCLEPQHSSSAPRLRLPQLRANDLLRFMQSTTDAAQLAAAVELGLPKNPLWKNESAVLSFVTTLIGGVHANVADQLDPSVLAQLSMTSLYAHIEEQLGAVAGVDYDKAWLRGHVDNLLVALEAGLEP